MPKADEDVAPEFYHHPAATLPQWRRNGAFVRVIAGRAFGEESPVRVFADTFNVAIDLEAGAEINISDAFAGRALYVLDGQGQLDGTDVPEKHLILLDHSTRPALRANTPMKAMLLAGEPLDGPRHLWCNFVSSSKERIELARRDWLEGKFGQIPGETEFIPLPER